jgi:hypothetical protein
MRLLLLLPLLSFPGCGKIGLSIADSGRDDDTAVDEGSGDQGGDTGDDGGTDDSGADSGADNGTDNGSDTGGGDGGTDGGSDGGTDGGADGGSDGGTDGGTDSGGDGGGDGGTDGGGDGGGGDLDCEGVTAAPHVGPNCVSGTIACGETVESTTDGGSEAFNDEFYDDATCFISGQPYDGSERVYELILPEGDAYYVDLVLDAPCEDLALATFYWTDEDACPTSGSSVSCDGAGAASDPDVRFYHTGSYEDRYLIAVDGDADAAFRLSVSCGG